jgi:hypothetical protein
MRRPELLAKKELTPKQAEIKTLLDAGRTPREIATELKISVNGCYQHLRRMRDDGNLAAAKRRPGAKRATRKRTIAPVPEGTGLVPQAEIKTLRGAAPVRTKTPLQAVRARQSVIESEIKTSRAMVDQARKAYDRQNESHAKLINTRADELKRLAEAETALAQSRTAAGLAAAGAGAAAAPAGPKPAPNRRNGNGSKRASKSAAASVMHVVDPEPAPSPAEPAGVTPTPGTAPADFVAPPSDGFAEE